MTNWMPVLHIRGGSKASSRLGREQDLKALDNTPEGEAFEKELLGLE